MLRIESTEYHLHPAYSRSFVFKAYKSNLKKAAIERDNRSETTDAMEFGSLIHTMLLEPLETNKRFLVAKADLRTTAGKEAKAKAISEGLTLIKPELFEVAISICASFNTSFCLMLAGGDAEMSFFKEIDGVEYKCRPDYINHGIIYDVKTCEDASPKGFLSSCYKYGYHLQAYMYMMLTGADDFVFLCVEKDAPYCTASYRLSAKMLAEAKDIFDTIHRKLMTKNFTGQYEGYSDNVMEIG
jgi:exodeoxyribonuclease VIII